MKRISILFVAFFITTNAAIAQVNFSGTWIYDSARSNLPDTGNRIIVHNNSQFSITAVKASNKSTIQYVLDGVEHTVSSETAVRNYKAVLDGGTLRITGKLTAQQRVHNIDEILVLSEDGLTLNHHVRILGPQGAQYRTWVYYKQK